jgi:hypothetical protein
LAASLVLSGDRAAAARLLNRPLSTPSEGPAPPDPEENALLDRLAHDLQIVCAADQGRSRLGVFSADQGRTASALQARLAALSVEEIEDAEQPSHGFSAILIRDRLERESQPRLLLEQAQRLCRAEGSLLLCVATGAWPLVAPGHAGREYNLGRSEFSALLPGRPLVMSFLPRGLVNQGGEGFFAGRWLVSAPAAGPPAGELDPSLAWLRTRPVPPGLLAEVQRAGLL